MTTATNKEGNQSRPGDPNSRRHLWKDETDGIPDGPPCFRRDLDMNEYSRKCTLKTQQINQHQR